MSAHPPAPRTEPQQAQSEIHLLRTIALALHEVDDVTAALQIVLREICNTGGWALGQAWLPRDDGTVLECSAAWYSHVEQLLPFRHASEQFVFSTGAGLPGLAWATQRPIWSRDVTLDHQIPRGPIAATVGLKAGMAIPVPAGQVVVAVLEFFVFEQRDEDAATVTMVAAAAAQLGQMLRRKQLEEQLRASESHLRAIVDTALDAIITIGPDSTVHSFNPGAERIFGYPAGEIVGQPLTRLMPERFRELHTTGVHRYLQTGEARVVGRMVEVAGLRKDGSEVPLELTVTEVPGAGAVRFAGILRDMSERKRLEAEREALLAAEQETSRRLRELAVLKADFTAMVAHELSAPVAAIGGLVRLVASGKLTPEVQAQVLSSIEQEVGILAKLVADVRNAATMERTHFDVQRCAIPLTVLLREAAAFAETLPGNHPISITNAADVPVLADPERIGQVMRNLLNNAAKYSADGAPITVSANPSQKAVQIAVADQGSGIHPHDLTRIFEKFGRGRDIGGRDVAGVGLGLYLSRQIVQAHGSQLQVASELGHGSVFSFELEVAI